MLGTVLSLYEVIILQGLVFSSLEQQKLKNNKLTCPTLKTITCNSHQEKRHILIKVISDRINYHKSNNN